MRWLVIAGWLAVVFLNHPLANISTSSCEVFDTGSCSTEGDTLTLEQRLLQEQQRIDNTAAAAVPTWRFVINEAGAITGCEWIDSGEVKSACPKLGPWAFEPAPDGQAPLTITDLAAFVPASGELVVQPEGWGVQGRPTNFYATATTHEQEGELLGEPVTVRFRPVSYAFDFGDGHTTTTSDPGAAWGEDESWTETATTHIYEERGTFTATVTITYEADVNVDGSWFTVQGTVNAAAPAVSVKIFKVETVLTNGDCSDNPDQPGCG